MTPLPPPQKGTLHTYKFNLTAFEYDFRNSSNALIFIGGLGNRLRNVPYVSALNESIGQDWRLFEIMTSSSGQGWGMGSLDRDVNEICALVKYLKEGLSFKKVVLIGHSTGCQDSIHFLLNKQNEQEIDGIILQAPVSDREATHVFMAKEKLAALNKEARQTLESQGPDAILPKKFSDSFFKAPISPYRWLSLVEKDGDDDYFSSDLSDERLSATFGKLTKPILVLYSGNDEFVPKTINKDAVVTNWKRFVKPELWNGIVVPYASHDVLSGSDDPEKAKAVLTSEVAKFLQKI